RDHYRLIGLDEALALAGDGFRVAGPTALIAFDDGYRDNFDLALPILADLGAPAAFFLTSGFIGGARLPWWDHVAYVLKRTAQPRLRLDQPEPLDLDLDRLGRHAAMMAVIAAYLRAERAEDPHLVAHLDERAGVDVAAEDPGRELFLTWDQARRLAGAGM